MERDQNQRNNEKKVIDDVTLKWLSQMETELKRKNGHLLFLKHVEELYIIVLSRRKKGNKCSNTKRHHTHNYTPTHSTRRRTDAHTQDMLQDKKSHDHEMDTTQLQPMHQTTTLHLKNGHLGHSNVVVVSLDLENAKIHAEIEATKLSASETEKQSQSLVRK
jgi:hypothetical protein